MAIKRGVERRERLLLPESVEEYVSAQNPVRVVDAFIEGLDLSKLGVEQREEHSIGPGSYDARALLKLYLYGYLNRIYSSRELEKATHRNLEVIWLMGKLHPDHWTINEFRKTNSKALKGLFKRFHLVCAHLDLFGKDLIGIDSAYFKASNSAGKNHTQGKLRKRLERIDEHIEAYIKELEVRESKAVGKVQSAEQLQEKLKAMEQKRAQVEELLEQVQNSETGQISEVDKDARSLKKGGQQVVGYHLQISVDDKHHLIVDNETVKTGTDSEHLVSMAKQSKQSLGVDKLNVVADQGYYSVEGVRQCSKAGITATVAMKKPKSGQLGLEHFEHNKDKDVLICPEGKELNRHKDVYYKSSQIHYKVYYNLKACKGCARLPQCSKGKYRKVKIPDYGAELEELKDRLQKQPELMRKRSAMVEHPFGTIKFWMGAYAVKTRGWEKVSAELSLSCLAYNIKRVIKIVGVEKLLEILPKLPFWLKKARIHTPKAFFQVVGHTYNPIKLQYSNSLSLTLNYTYRL